MSTSSCSSFLCFWEVPCLRSEDASSRNLSMILAISSSCSPPFFRLPSWPSPTFILSECKKSSRQRTSLPPFSGYLSLLATVSILRSSHKNSSVISRSLAPDCLVFFCSSSFSTTQFPSTEQETSLQPPRVYHQLCCCPLDTALFPHEHMHSYRMTPSRILAIKKRHYASKKTFNLGKTRKYLSRIWAFPMLS